MGGGGSGSGKNVRTCSGLPVFGGGEAIPLGHDNGGYAQDADDGQIDEPRLGRAVEGVVKPWDKTSHNQQGDS